MYLSSMKTLRHPSNHSYLIWLFSFMVLLHVGTDNSGSGSMAPLRNLRQTELTLTNFELSSAKKSLSFFTEAAKHATRFTDDLSFNTRIFLHTHVAALKWKMIGKQVLSSPINVVHSKVAQNDDDDLSILKG